MDAVKNNVKRLVKVELAAANRKFRMFASAHEGVAVVQEEIVEATQELNKLHEIINELWVETYSDVPQISTKNCTIGLFRWQLKLSKWRLWRGSLSAASVGTGREQRK